MNVIGRSLRRRVGQRARRTSLHLLTLVVALGVTFPAMLATTAAHAAPPAATANDGVLRVLLFYKTNFHASQAQARVAVKELAAELATQYGQTLEIEETDNPAAFTTANLATKDTVFFAQTGGVLFNTEQRAALEAYIKAGGGFAGVHYASWSAGTVSEHDANPFFAQLVGAVSNGHPEDGRPVRPGRVVVKDATHPLAAGLAAEVTRSDEWYDWIANPAQDVRTLVEADESSYADSDTGGYQGTTHPITWCQQDGVLGAGRSWFTGMGHEGSAYSEPFMRTQIKNGMAYTAGLLTADCSAPKKDRQGTWDKPVAPTGNPATDPVGDLPTQNGVTPWPLVPINMALTSDGKVQSFGSVNFGGSDATKYDWSGDSTLTQGGQMEIDVWDPTQPRTLATVNTGVLQNTTYTDLFCAMQVMNPHTGATMTVGGDDGLGGNAPNDASLGVTSYTTNSGLQDEAPMNFPRWYPTGTTMPDGDIVVQGGSLRGGPGGPGVQTPEVYTPDSGSGWKLLEGATSALAYGDGGGANGPDENRWWYPRAFVAPGKGTLFNISGTQMFELDPEADNGRGVLTPRGTLTAQNGGNQGALGNPVGATSTAAMYRPGKILQVGGGTWSNGGGPDGARAGITVDITGGTANPVVKATAPMKYQRHWPTATILPDGDVIVTGGGRENNGRDDTVTNPEIFDADTETWSTVEVPQERARLYHSTALLLPDGRVMVGGGGTPGPRNYSDVEYYSPAYLFDGDQRAVRPVVTKAPKKIGYAGQFQLSTAADVSRVTLVRNGSVTHGFNNDQNFQDLAFTKTAGGISVTSPKDGTYAPPGTYMVFVWNSQGTPSVASMMNIDPTVEMDSRTPQVVEQFEFPKVPVDWRGGNPANVIDVAPGSGRMAPWSVDSGVQLVRGTTPGLGALGLVGYSLALGATGDLDRTLTGLDPGREYRVSLRHARDSRSTATGSAGATLKVGSLTQQLTSNRASNGAGTTSANAFETFVGTFTASQRTETLRLTGAGSGPGLVVDNLVVIAADPGTDDVAVRYEFDEGTGRTSANLGSDSSFGPAVLTGDTGWSTAGINGGAVDLTGGSNANAVDLPDDLLQGEENFTTSFWARPDTKGNWIGMFHIGDGTGDGTGASFFQLQMQTQANGNTGLAATFKGKGTTGNTAQERVYAVPTQDVVQGQWNHVAFTRSGTTGTLFLNGKQVATKTDFTIDMADVGATSNNWLGRNGFPDPAFDGRMDDVRAYTSALTASDIAALYADGTATATTTALSVSPASPAPFGEPVTVSATVTPNAGTAAVSGSAQLFVDGIATGDAVAVDAAGKVSFPALTTLAPGLRTFEVRFTAGAGFRDSTATTTYTVSRPPVAAGVPVHYKFDEGTGTTSVNSGTDPSIGPATLVNGATWTPDGQYGAGVNLPGGNAASQNQVNLPNNITEGMDTEFTASVWARPDALPNWVPLLQIGSSTDSFFLLQSSMENGTRGFGATFKKAGNATQERLFLPGEDDLAFNTWTHVVFTLNGSTGKIYFDGRLVATRTDFTIDIGDIGVAGTTANYLGGTSWGDPRFDGLVDDLRIYGYELSAEQVGDLFEGEPQNAAPVAVDDSGSTDAGTTLTVAAPGLLANDTDAEDDLLTAVVATQPAHGTVTVGTDGSWTYVPAAGYVGTDSFTYTANDATGASTPATVTITVRPVATTPPVVTPPVVTPTPPPVVTPPTVPGAPVPAKAAAVLGLKLPKQVAPGQRVRVRIGAGTVPVTGRVTVKIAGKKFSVVIRKNGKAVFRLPKGMKPGKQTLKVVYAGSTLVERAKIKKAVVVRR